MRQMAQHSFENLRSSGGSSPTGLQETRDDNLPRTVSFVGTFALREHECIRSPYHHSELSTWVTVSIRHAFQGADEIDATVSLSLSGQPPGI